MLEVIICAGFPSGQVCCRAATQTVGFVSGSIYLCHDCAQRRRMSVEEYLTQTASRRSVVVDPLIKDPTLTIAELAARTGLAPGTVGTYIGEARRAGELPRDRMRPP